MVNVAFRFSQNERKAMRAALDTAKDERPSRK